MKLFNNVVATCLRLKIYFLIIDDLAPKAKNFKIISLKIII